MTGEQTTLLQILWLAGLLFIRVGIPLLVVAAIAIVLRRMDHRWQVEAETRSRMQLQVAPLLVPHPVAGVPCWEQRHCDGQKCADCAAARSPEAPCWMSRSAALGSLPAECPTCGIFRERATLAPITLTVHTPADIAPAA
jgi:hypothetical protein